MTKRIHRLVILSLLVIFGGWIEEARGQSDLCLVNLKTNAGGTLSAFYIDHNPFTGEDETVYVFDGNRIPKMVTLEITAKADTGYEIGQWYLDGSIIEGAKGSSRQTTVIRKDTQIKVDFEPSGQDFEGVFFTFKEDTPEGTITATYQDSNYNDIVVHSGQKVPMEVMVTFTATPKEGYEFDFWRVNGEKNPFYLKRFGNTGKLSAQTNDEIEAVFKSIKQTERKTVTFRPRGDGGSLTATVDGNEITSGSQVEVGKTVLFTAKPNADYKVSYWFMNDQLQHHIAKGQMTFEKEINLDLTVEVSFETVVQETYHITFQEENDWGYLTVQSWPNGINAMGMPISSGDPIDVGTIVTFDVELQEGYELKAFIIDGVEYQANATSMYGFPRYQTTLTKDLSVSVKAEKPTAQEYVITFNANPEGGSIQGSYMTMAGGSFTTVQLNSGDKVPESSMVTFNASANEGYEFVHWTQDGSEVSTDLEYMFEMSATCEVQGVFKQITTPSGHLITLSVGTGGTLKCAYSNGQEVQSGDYVADGSALRFNAEPESGYVVDQWTINGEVYTKGNGRKTIIQRASKDMNVGVSFKKDIKDYSITYSVDEGALMKSALYYDKVNYNYIEVNNGDKLPEGTEIEFEVDLQMGYTVKEWLLNDMPIDGSQGKTSLTITLRENSNIHVALINSTSEQKVTYTATTGGSIQASIIGQPFASGDMISEGSYITFTATPNEGFITDQWTINGDKKARYTGKNEIVERLGNAPMTVEVSFKENKAYTISYTATNDWGVLSASYNKPNGQEVLVSPGESVADGTELFFTATPNKGFVIDTWTCNGKTVEGYNNNLMYSVVVHENITIDVKTRELAKHIVTFDSNPEGGSLEAYYTTFTPSYARVNVHSGDLLVEGTRVTFEATSSEGYEFDHWVVNGQKIDNEGQSTDQLRITSVSIREATTVQAIFINNSTPRFEVIYSAGEGGSISATIGTDKTPIQSGDKIEQYTQVTFTATPEEGYVVDQWTVDGQNQQFFAGKTELTRSVRKALNINVTFKTDEPAKQYIINYTKENEWGTLVAYYDKVGERVNVSPGDKIEKGYLIIFLATVKEGYSIDHWTYNGSKTPTVTPEILSVIVKEEMTVAVVCKKDALCTVTFDADTNGGTMTASYFKDEDCCYKEIFINSGDQVALGTAMTFEVTPHEGYELDYWLINDVKRACDKYTPLRLSEIPINEDTYVKPVYKTTQPAQYEVTFSSEDGGRIVAGIAPAQDGIESGAMIDEGTSIRFRAIPDKANGYQVDQWTINGEIQAELAGRASILYSIRAKTNVSVSFKKEKSYKIIYTDDNEWGTLTAFYYNGGKKIDIMSGQEVKEGTFVEFLATVKEGYVIDYWTCNGETLPCANVLKPALTVKADATIEAHYHKIVKYTVNYEATSDKGSVKASYLKNVNFQYIETPVTSGDQLEANTKVTFTATAGEGYELDSWTINGDKAVATERVKLEGEKLIITLDKDVTVVALFKGDGAVIEYGFDLVGVSVTSVNVNKLNELVGVSIGKDGYIRYDASAHKLSLRDVTLDNSSALLFAKGTNSYTIELAGTNSFIGQLSTESNLTITGQGTLLVSNEERSGISVGSGASLVIKGKECLVDVKVSSENGVGAIHGVWDANSTLKIEDATVKAESTITGTAEAPFPYAIGGFKAIESINGKITIPENGKIGKHTFTFGGKEYTLAFVLSKDDMPTSKVEISHHVNALTEVLETGINVYPNPFAERIVITIPVEKLGQTAYISSMLGELIQQVVLVDIETVIYTEALTSGTYILRIGNETQLLIKE